MGGGLEAKASLGRFSVCYRDIIEKLLNDQVSST
jgi:hypothetical protein